MNKLVVYTFCIMSFSSCKLFKKKDTVAPSAKELALVIGNPFDFGLDSVIAFPVGANYNPKISSNNNESEQEVSSDNAVTFSKNSVAKYDKRATMEFVNSSERDFDIRNILFVDSVYAIRFYEFCKEFERFGKFVFDVDQLKAMFGLSERYKNYFDFKLKVLQQARAELIKHSELYFDFEEIKERKKIVRLRFTIIKNNNLQREGESEDGIVSAEFRSVYEKVSEFVSESTVLSWFEKYPAEQIEKSVSYCLSQLDRGGVRDMGAYLHKMVSTPDFIDSAEATVQEKKKKNERQRAEQQAQKSIQEQADEMRIQAHEMKMRILAELIQNEKIKKELIEKISTGLFKNYYKTQLSFEQNIESPAIAGFMISAAVQLYPEKFAVADLLIKRAEEMEKV